MSTVSHDSLNQRNRIPNNGSEIYNYIIVNGRNPSNNTYQISIDPKGRLIDLSNSILMREGYRKDEYICSFYSQEGQPLVGFLSAMRYVKCYKVIESLDLLYIIISKNSDKISDVKDILGMEIGLPPDCISIVGESEDNKSLDQCEKKKFTFCTKNAYNKDTFKVSTYIDQTDEGKRLFRGFIACFPHHFPREKLSKFIGYLRYFSHNFTPLLYAVYNLRKNQKNFDTEKIALEEGMIVTFRNICELFVIPIAETKIFERSMELFGFILELCKNEALDLGINEEFEELPRTCEMTQKRMDNPVEIQRDDDTYAYYDLKTLNSQKQDKIAFKKKPNEFIVNKKLKKDLEEY